MSMSTSPVVGDSPAKRKERRRAAEGAYAQCPLCNKRCFSSEVEDHVQACLDRVDTSSSAAATLSARNDDGHRASSSSSTNPRKRKQSLVDKENAAAPRIKRVRAREINPKLCAIPEAPVFRPTLEEFADPIKYISSIRSVGQRYGICKIIPPVPQEQWMHGKTMTNNVAFDKYFFRTKSQRIHELARRGHDQEFIVALRRYMADRGTPLPTELPLVQGRSINLFLLYLAVESKGGYEALNQLPADAGWTDIVRDFDITPVSLDAALTLRQLYATYIHSFTKSSFMPAQAMKKYTKLDVPLDPSAPPARFARSSYPTYADTDRDIKNRDDRDDDDEDDDDDDEDDDNDDDAEEYGFGVGRVYSLSSFRRKAARFTRKWFNTSEDEVLAPEEVESAFWKLVDDADEPCQVNYGSDLDVQTHGSGFPADDLSGWNLNFLPTRKGSLLRHLRDHIGGVTVPMMYIGMTFSCFCWHTEDNYLYSINYVHTGAPKVWYGVPSSSAEHFETVMKAALPSLFRNQPDLLHQLITMLSPVVFAEHGVTVVRSFQYPGEFIVTFPRAYHGGFNAGFNCAEAVNFALADWIPHGSLCHETYRSFKRASVVSIHELVHDAILQERDVATLQWLYSEFSNLRLQEEFYRGRLLASGLSSCARWDHQKTGMRSAPCSFCNAECFISAVVCECTPDRVACLRHALQTCSCPINKKILLMRLTLSQMDSILTNARLRIHNGSVPMMAVSGNRM